MLLPDCTLFPHGGLPLYIFEDRYRKMLREVLEGDCVFSVGRKLDTDADYDIPASDIGTVGLVRACKHREDGTSELLLHGVVRVRFTEWFDDSDFPVSSIEPIFSESLEPDADASAKKALRYAITDCISGLSEDVRKSVMTLVDQADDAGLMADLAAQQLVHDSELRQDLLDTIPVGDRVSMLCGYLEKMSQ
ncbi:MAG: LON peptidase substrate-binding domain-containing protein [Akkermansiaceae bacterium]